MDVVVLVPSCFIRNKKVSMALQRLGLEYRHEKFGMRNRVERFFRYLKERTVVFHHKMSARDHVQGITNLKLFLSLFTIYYQVTRAGR